MATQGSSGAAVRLGLELLGGPVPASFADVAAWAEAAEGGGFDSVWVGDDPRPGEPFEATTLLGALAMRTSTLRLGTLVPPGSGRPPGAAAKVLSGVDVVSGGRLLAGVGASPGAPGGEAVARRLSEAVSVVRALFGGDAVTLTGRTWHLDGAVNRPPPLLGSTTPIVVVADGELTADLGRLVDVVVVRGSPGRVAEVAEIFGAGERVSPAGERGASGPAVVWRGRAGRGRGRDVVRAPGTWLDLDRPDACVSTLRELGAAGAAGVIVAVDGGIDRGIDRGIVGAGATVARGGSPGDGPERPGGYGDEVRAAGRFLAPLVAAELGHGT